MGIRYPLQMLLVPLPQWLAGQVDEAIKPTIFAISLVMLVYVAIPWSYVFQHYLKLGGDRWRPMQKSGA